jgi:hypothetical protein
MSKTAPRHGSIHGYRNDGCRCIHCKAAKKHYERERRAAYLAGDWVSHGTRSAWDAGCRRKYQRNHGNPTVRCHVCDCHVGLSRDGRLRPHKVAFTTCGGSGYMPRRAAA